MLRTNTIKHTTDVQYNTQTKLLYILCYLQKNFHDFKKHKVNFLPIKNQYNQL